MATPTNLKIDGLDFNNIKTNFKEFLKGQTRFADYNFDSAGLSTLIDVLSYNTYYNSFYLNMVSNEAFLSTAQRRNSVVAAARSLNYTPRSVSSARIVANLNVNAVGTPATLLVPRNTRFEASTETGTYYFLNLNTISITNISGNYYANNVVLVEGEYIDEKYIKDITDTNQRFIISNEDIDTSTLTVSVINSTSDSSIRNFTKAESYVNLTETSQVYFLQEIEDGKFEVKFGDGISGIALQDGNVVVLEYLISSGAEANDVNALVYASSVTSITDITATVTTPAYSGDAREAIERIKFNAPKSYSAQNRLVTTEDYTSLMLQQPNVASCIVWGGEDNVPQFYGKVFIAIQPKTSEVLTTTEKTNLINYVINPKKILTITPEIVDPEYIYLLISASVKFDSNQIVLSAVNLNSQILDTVMAYKESDLGQFSKYFRYSKLSRLIDTCERSILSSVLSIQLRKDVPIQLNSPAKYTIDFANPINDITRLRATNHPYNAGNKITSNEFTYAGYTQCYLEENGGIMRIYQVLGSSNIGIIANAGTIDYDTGTITLNSFSPSEFTDGGTTLKLTAIPRDPDILPLRTQIISIREEDVAITLIDDNAISLTNR